ncbi:B-cell receptor CD22 isoform X2 [Oryzias melastigma]|uniref:B-cell receptor CD22 isoform X2 n=1 Tax=Oryzias melastigma TaxID=30732 RepID=UPI00168D4993|nr:B-cell receptor CD22 isoform X2 [Oryzias melastigma]
MSLTAALRGFVVLLCCFSVVKSQTDWKVKYYQTEICADKGSTVVILCSYDFPVMLNRVSTTVKKSFWFIRTEGEPVDLREDPEYKDRVTYSSSPKSCYLIISGVRESDSAVYKFMFITNHQTGRYIGEPGVRLTVRDLQVLLVSTSVQQEDSDVQLKCFIRCDPKGLEEYVWFINGEETRSRIQSETSQTFLYRSWNSSTDRISCSLRSSKTDQSPEVYAPRTPTVSLDPPTEILEGRSVTLTCSSDANPAAKFNWFKKMKSSVKILSQGPQFVFDSIQSTDSGDYYCKVQNYLGLKISDFKLEVKYAPKNISVSVNPPEILEGSSVTLTCSSDANPAANYTWFKAKNRLNAANVYHLPSININDSGIYRCKSENKHGWINSSVHIDVLYPPRSPSVHLSRTINGSGQILEGSSVTLTCSSDANPAANYTWFKENKDSPKSEEQMFTISDITAEDGGLYICVAQNKLGQQNSTVQVSVGSGSVGLAAACSIPAVLLTLIFLAVLFLKIFRRSSGPLVIRSQDKDAQNREGSDREDPTSRHPAEDETEIQYATVTFTKRQEDPLYSNIEPVKAKRRRDAHEDKEDVVYSLVGPSRSPAD